MQQAPPGVPPSLLTRGQLNGAANGAAKVFSIGFSVLVAELFLVALLFFLWSTAESPVPPPYAQLDCSLRIDSGIRRGIAVTPDGTGLWLVGDGQMLRYAIPEECR